MRTTPCPSCGAETLPEARFCRRCGATLRDGGGEAGVAPHAPSGTARADRPATTAELVDGTPGDPSVKDTSSAASRLDPADPDAMRGHGSRSNGARAGEEFDAEETLVLTEAGAPDFGDLDSERTVAVSRRVEPLGPGGGFARGRGDRTPGGARGGVAADDGVDAEGYYAGPRPAPRRWPVVLALCLSALLFTAAGAWLASRYLARPRAVNSNSLPPATPPPPDAKQLFEDKLAEAEALLAQGDLDKALAALREANTIDPANARARRRLGEILFDTGARRAAISEFQAVTRAAPQDFTAWRQLAAAQFAEGMHREAAESYRRVIALVGETRADPQDLLSYADALRLSDQAEEARAVYERLAAAPYALVAEAARERLSALPSPTPEPSPTPPADEGGEVAPGDPGSSAPAPPGPAQQPAPQPTPQQPAPPAPRGGGTVVPASERYRRGVELWPSNRAAAVEEFRAAARAGNPDAHYYLGLSYVLGRNLHALQRAEVVAALEHFQRAERGQFAEQARRHARQLGQEFDRLRLQ
jgi:tetratricopeptide (TPR) repeat protein